MLARLTRTSYRHRRLVLVGWIIGVVLLTVAASNAGSDWSQSSRLNGTDSQAAADLMGTRFPERDERGSSAEIVVKAEMGVNEPAINARLVELFAEIADNPQVAEVVSPFASGGAGQISADGRIAYADVNLNADRDEITPTTADQLNQLVADANGDGLQVEGSGGPFGGGPELGSTELLGIAAAMVILLLAFGSLLAMGLPIMTALFGIGVGFAVVGLLSHVASVPDFATQLAAMIGLGVGIDYALFVVTRYRQGLHHGLDPESSVVAALDSAGRAVFFAGTTVVISLLGMLLAGISFIGGLGVAGASVVAVTMAASLTLLPAMLGFVGHNIDRLKIPGMGKVRDPRTTAGYRWAHTLQRNPWPFAVVGAVVLLAMSIPALRIQLGSTDEGNLPTTQTVRRAYDLKAEGFGAGASAPLMLVAEISSPHDVATLTTLTEMLETTPGIADVSPAQLNPAGDAAIVRVTPTTSSQDRATVGLLSELRDRVIPSVTDGTSLTVHVGGETAASADVASKLQSRLPVFIGVILALSFLLLLLVFRSVVVPAKAVVMNLLSIGAAYGVLVAVFQWGWGASLFDVGKPGPIEPFLPMIMFAILFGLSMDYEVFLLSRIKEEYDVNGNDNREAVAHGLAVTARVITAAAAIMICVFGSFMLSGTREIKQFGLGLAVAVLVDATIVRMVLVPATMELIGKNNWWLPKWLSWLPRVNIEGQGLPDAHPIEATGVSTHEDEVRV
jgi:putative drug exporter of the RND superfamily